MEITAVDGDEDEDSANSGSNADNPDSVSDVENLSDLRGWLAYVKDCLNENYNGKLDLS